MNALFDLDSHTYTDAFLQPVHNKDGFRAFCSMADDHVLLPGTKDVFIGNRGYCSYNNMAHILEKGQCFLFRTKDIHSKGLAGKFDFPEDGSFDITVHVTLARTLSKKKLPQINGYKRFVDKAASFGFIEYGSPDVYELLFPVNRNMTLPLNCN